MDDHACIVATDMWGLRPNALGILRHLSEYKFELNLTRRGINLKLQTSNLKLLTPKPQTNLSSRSEAEGPNPKLFLLSPQTTIFSPNLFREIPAAVIIHILIPFNLLPGSKKISHNQWESY